MERRTSCLLIVGKTSFVTRSDTTTIPCYFTALFATACLLGATAHAQTVISSLPYTITAGGTYVLNSNLNSSLTSGNLISINASNVTLDFQNHYIAGPVNNTAATTIGIAANEQSNLNIRNGTIAFCSYGIKIVGNGTATTNSVDEQITNMRVTYSYGTGIDIEHSPSSVISGCQVSQTGFSTSTNSAVGIFVSGAGVTVQNCVVSNLINATGNQTIGIYNSTGSFTRQCQVSNAEFGIVFGIYQDNLISASTQAISNGTDGGGNVSDGQPYTNAIGDQSGSTSSRLRLTR